MSTDTAQARAARGASVMKILFLDIDGVLNGHDYDQAAQSTRIQYRCIRQLNRVIAATDAKIVLSSAWRYMILKKSMTTSSFEYLMRTHGTCGFRLIGTTACDESFGFPKEDDSRRAKQVKRWLRQHRQVKRFVVIDDEDFGFSKHGLPFVQTKPKWGLSRRDADQAINILKGTT